MTRTHTRFFAVLLLVLPSLGVAVAGCGGKRHGNSRPWSPVGFPHSIAIAPLANDTLSVEGPKILRVRLRRAMAGRGYQTQKLGETDDHLRGIGITLGGQVPATTWEEMRDALGTDAVLTGRLIKHSAVVAGVINSRTVEAEVVLTDLRTGQILWHARDKIVDVEDSGVAAASKADNAQEGLALCLIGTVCGLISGASQHDMRQENEQLAAVLARRAPLPGPPAQMPVAVAAAPAAMSADARPLSNKPAVTSSEAGATSLKQLDKDAKTGAMPREEVETVVEESLASAPAPTAPLPGPANLSADVLAVAPKGAGNGQVAVPASALKPSPESAPAPAPAASPTPAPASARGTP